MKPMNRILRQVTIDKLVIKCSHCEIEEGEIKKEEVVETAFEKFKKTAKYKEIMKR